MITVNDLLKLPIIRRCNLVAGKNGLNNKVSWPYVVLSSTIVNWANDYELAIYSKDMEKTVAEQIEVYRRLINEAQEANLSALIISLNSSVMKELPKDLLAQADAFALPVFIAPWNISSNDLSKAIISYLVKHQTKAPLSDEFLRGMIYGTEADIERNLRNFSFSGHEITSFFMLHMSYSYAKAATSRQRSSDSDEIELSYIEQQISRYISLPFTLLNACEMNHSFLYTLSADNYDKSILNPMLVKISQAIHRRYPDLMFHIGVSAPHNSLSELNICYGEARISSLFTNYLSSIKPDFQYADELLSLQLLLASGNAALQSFCEKVLGVLGQQELSPAEQELQDSLRCYIQNSCHLARTADALFIHKNTLRNRLVKIEEFTHRHPGNPNELYDLMTALLAYDVVYPPSRP